MYQYRVHVLSSPIPKALSEKKKQPSVSGAFQAVPSTVNFILGISRADLWSEGTLRYSRDNELLRRSLYFASEFLSRNFTFVNVRFQTRAWSQVKSLVVFKMWLTAASTNFKCLASKFKIIFYL